MQAGQIVTPLEIVLQDLEHRVEGAVPPGHEIPGQRAEVALTRYRDRLSTLEELRSELTTLGYRGPAFASLINSAVLDRDRAVRGALRDSVTTLFERGFLGVLEYRRRLAALGIGELGVTLELGIATERRALRDLQDATTVYLRALARGAVTVKEARQKLTGLGLTPLRVELEVLQELLGRLPTARVELPVAAAELGALQPPSVPELRVFGGT